jgi:hypothetical protein
MHYNCANCGHPLNQPPERSEDQWIIRCLTRGARNIIIPIFELVGWRETDSLPQ